MPFWSCHFPSNTKYSVLILYARGVKIICTEGHIINVVALKVPVVTESKAYEAGGEGGGRPPGLENFQGKLCFQGKHKLLKNPE